MSHITNHNKFYNLLTMISLVVVVVLLPIVGISLWKGRTAVRAVELKLDESQGTTINDNDRLVSGTITNAVWKTKDVCLDNSCLYFDGTGDYVSFGDDADLDFIAADTFTISLWFRHAPITSGTQVLISKYLASTGTDGGYKIQMESDGDITFGIDDDQTSFPEDSVTSTLATYDDNRWHHVAAVKNGTTSIALYIDGRLIGTNSSTTADNTLANTDAFYIGIDGDGSSNGYNGFIDEVKIARSAYTAGQIASDMQKGSPVGGAQVQIGRSNTDALSDGLVGYWKMDEATWSGTLAEVVDSSGNGNHGQAQGAAGGKAYPSTGKFNNGGYFDGVDDYVSVPSNDQLRFIGSDFTVCIWAKATSLTVRNYLLAKGLGTGREGYAIIGNDSGNLIFEYSDTYANNDHKLTAGTYSVNTWVYTVLVINKNEHLMKAYVNGRPVGTMDIAGIDEDVSGTYNLEFGRNGAYNFQGSLDEARIYNRALSSSEVSQLYQYAPGPVGYWKMDEKSDGNSAVTRVDSSGYGNNLTDTNTTPSKIGKFGNASEHDRSKAEYVSIADGSQNGLDIAGDMTISAWVRPKDLSSYSAMSVVAKKNSYDTDCGYNLLVTQGGTTGGGVAFGISQDGTTRVEAQTGEGALPFDNTKWSHIAAVVIIGQSISIYVNGELIPNGVNNPLSIAQTSIFNSTYAFQIGGDGAEANFYNGSIDEVKVYNYARTQDQIVEDMNAGHPAPGSPVGSAALSFDFEGITGDTVHNMGNLGTILDGDMEGIGTTCPGGSHCPTPSTHGRIGNGLDFDGSALVETSDNAVFNTQTFTVSAWFKRTGAVDGSNGAGVAGRWRTNEGAFIWVDPSNIIKFPVGASSHISSGITANLNTWYHVVGTFDGSTSNIYVNGVKKASQADSTSYATITQGFEIGRYAQDSSTYFPGQIDEVKFYNFALTDEQVKAEYNQGQGMVMGSLSDTSGLSGGSVASNSASAAFCVPGDTASCVGPIGEWKMDERSGTTVLDTSGNNLNGTFYGTTSNQWKTGKYNSAGNFNGTNNYIDIDDNAILTPPGDITYQAWVRLNQIPSVKGGMEYIIQKRNSTGSPEWQSFYLLISTTGDKPYARWTNSTGSNYNASSSFTVAANTWYHMAVTKTSSSIKIYVNGVDTTIASDAPTGTLLDSNTTLRIGSDSTNSGNTNGLIDEVKIYNYARTSAQIAWDYNRGAPVAQYDFDECSGNTAHDTAPKADKLIAGLNSTISIGGAGSYTSSGNCSSGTSSEAWNGGTNGKYSASLAFDGTDDFIYTTNVSSLKLQNFTLSTWVKPSTFTSSGSSRPYILAEQPVGAWDDGRGYAIGLHNTGYVTVSLGTASGSWTTISGTKILTLNEWNHIVITYDGTNLLIYINGKLDTSSAPAITISYTDKVAGGPNAQTFYIGAQHNNNSTANTYTSDMYFFQGFIDDVKIYNYPLTATQVKNLYNNNSAVQFGQ